MTHFITTANTDDYAYGQTNCIDLAENYPERAVNNADSHEYAAENPPPFSRVEGCNSDKSRGCI